MPKFNTRIVFLEVEAESHQQAAETIHDVLTEASWLVFDVTGEDGVEHNIKLDNNETFVVEVTNA